MTAVKDVAWLSTVLTDGHTTTRSPDRARRTVIRVLAGNLVMLVILVPVAYLVGAKLAERQALADAERFTRLIGNTVVGPHLTKALIAHRPRAVARLDRVVNERLLPTTSIVRVKVWAADGTVLYSDAHEMIGQTHVLDESELVALASGGTVSDVSPLDAEENLTERGLAPELLEAYTAIETADGDPVLFEAYLSSAEVKERRASVFHMLALLGFLLVVLLALFHIGFAAMNLRWLRHGQAELERSSAEVSERERRSVTRDLHDGPVQELIGTAYLLDGAGTATRVGDLDRGLELLDTAKDSVASCIRSLRSTLIAVYPQILDERGLGPALEDLVAPLRARGLVVEIEDTLVGTVPEAAAQATYRAAQEATRNVSRHAQASRVTVRLHGTRGRLYLEVDDDGVGLDLARLGAARVDPAADSSGHLGLRTLCDLAHDLGGRLEIRTAPGFGTHLRWEIPL